jgi:hypothetical protein
MAVFMLSMIFAFSLVAMATVVMTILALCFVRWLLGIGQFLDTARAPQDENANEVNLRPSRAIS